MDPKNFLSRQLLSLKDYNIPQSCVFLQDLPIDILMMMMRKLEWSDQRHMMQLSTQLRQSFKQMPMYLYSLYYYDDQDIPTITQFENIIAYTGILNHETMLHHLDHCRQLQYVKQLDPLTTHAIPHTLDFFQHHSHMTYLSLYVSLDQLTSTWPQLLPRTLTHLNLKLRHFRGGSNPNAFNFILDETQAAHMPTRLTHLKLYYWIFKHVHLPPSVQHFQCEGIYDDNYPIIPIILSPQLKSLHLHTVSHTKASQFPSRINIQNYPITLTHIKFSGNVELTPQSWQVHHLNNLKKLSIIYKIFPSFWHQHLTEGTFDQHLCSLVLKSYDSEPMIIACPKRVTSVKLQGCTVDVFPSCLESLAISGHDMDPTIKQWLTSHPTQLKKLKLRYNRLEKDDGVEILTLVNAMTRLEYLCYYAPLNNDTVTLMEQKLQKPLFPPSLHTLSIRYSLQLRWLQRYPHIKHLQFQHLYLTDALQLPPEKHVNMSFFWLNHSYINTDIRYDILMERKRVHASESVCTIAKQIYITPPTSTQKMTDPMMHPWLMILLTCAKVVIRFPAWIIVLLLYWAIVLTFRLSMFVTIAFLNILITCCEWVYGRITAKT